MKTKDVTLEVHKGAASVTIELDEGIVKVYHDDGTILSSFIATDRSWDIIWEGILEAKTEALENLNQSIIESYEYS